MTTGALTLRSNGLDQYMAEVSRAPLLSREEETQLARRYRDEGDPAAAHKLVVSNLRFVVKVAYQYKGYGYKLLDLVQEGNIGLMTAVKKFDPDRGYRLISYAVWWIRAHIQSYIMRSWSLVKLGSGRTNRRLFFKLRSARSQAEQDAGAQQVVRSEDLAKQLGVNIEDIEDMEVRMAGRDFSLDAPLDMQGDASHLDMLSEQEVVTPDEEIYSQQRHRWLNEAVESVRGDLNDKESHILERRLLDDEPQTLAEIGDHFGVSRERVRQLESRVLKKLRSAMPEAAEAV